MNKNLTEVVFILDRSGSMHGMESDTIGGFNSVIEKQKQIDGDVLVSTVLFNNEVTVLHDRVSLNRIVPMRESDFIVGGYTALLDALGGGIRHIRNIHKYARPEDVPAHTLFVIMTDGLENASRMFTAERVKKMISCAKEKDSWEFLFMAANIDAVETAERYGIDAPMSVNYHNDPRGARTSYDAIHRAVSCMRTTGKVTEDFRADADRDFRTRS